MGRMGPVGQTASLPGPFRGSLDLVEGEMCESARMMERPEVGVTWAQLCRPLQQSNRLLLATRPDQSVAERKISLGETGVERDGPLQGGDRLVEITVHAQGAAEHALIHAVAIVECDGRSRHPQCIPQ